MKEFKVDNVNDYEAGQEIKVGDMFQAGDRVDVSGVSRGKGYQELLKGTDRECQQVSWFQVSQGCWLDGFQRYPIKGYQGEKLPGTWESKMSQYRTLAL